MAKIKLDTKGGRTMVKPFVRKLRNGKNVKVKSFTRVLPKMRSLPTAASRAANKKARSMRRNKSY